MKVYETDRLRNLAIIGHGGAGKTSLVEAMLFNAGHTTGWAGLTRAMPLPIICLRRLKERYQSARLWLLANGRSAR